MKHNEKEPKVNNNKIPYLCASFKDATYCTKRNPAIQVDRKYSILLPLLFGLSNSIETPFSLTGDEETKPLTEKQLKHLTPAKIKKLMRCTPKVCEDIQELEGVFLDINTENFKTVISYDGMYWTQKIYQQELGTSDGVLIAESTGDTLTIYNGEEEQVPYLKLDVDYIEDLEFDLEENFVDEDTLNATAYLKELKDDGCFLNIAGFLYSQLCLGKFKDLIPFFDECFRKYVREFYELLIGIDVASGEPNNPDFFLDLDKNIVGKIEEVAKENDSTVFYTVCE